MINQGTGGQKTMAAAALFFALGLASNVSGLVTFVTGKTLADLAGWKGNESTDSEANATTTTSSSTTSTPTTTTPEPTTTTTTEPFHEPSEPTDDVDALHGGFDTEDDFYWDEGPSLYLDEAGFDDEGFFTYNVTVAGHPPDEEVTIRCHDSEDPQGFDFDTVFTDEYGQASVVVCYKSPDGPEFWVTTDGIESNVVTWSESYY